MKLALGLHIFFLVGRRARHQANVDIQGPNTIFATVDCLEDCRCQGATTQSIEATRRYVVASAQLRCCTYSVAAELSYVRVITAAKTSFNVDGPKGWRLECPSLLRQGHRAELFAVRMAC